MSDVNDEDYVCTQGCYGQYSWHGLRRHLAIAHATTPEDELMRLYRMT